MESGVCWDVEVNKVLEPWMCLENASARLRLNSARIAHCARRPLDMGSRCLLDHGQVGDRRWIGRAGSSRRHPENNIWQSVTCWAQWRVANCVLG
jgi:hypothetical protein